VRDLEQQRVALQEALQAKAAEHAVVANEVAQLRARHEAVAHTHEDDMAAMARKHRQQLDVLQEAHDALARTRASLDAELLLARQEGLSLRVRPSPAHRLIAPTGTGTYTGWGRVRTWLGVCL
jgi:hypothetical protein